MCPQPKRNWFDGQLSRFDITIPKSLYATWKDVCAALSPWCKAFVFQLEKGEQTDYLHWQVRLSLAKKATCAALLSTAVQAIGGHWTVTSTNVHTSPKVFNYVMKAQTRVEGPWTDNDIPREKTLTRQLKFFFAIKEAGKLYPWQIDAESLAKDEHDRYLNYIYDPHYNSGKSIFCEYLEYTDVAEEIPGIFTLAEDIMQYVFSMPTAKCYLFDMPAAMKKEKMNQMYTGLEQLKNGFIFDKRYEGKKRRIDRPGMLVFANNLPKLDLMAPDRWKVWYLTPDKRLVRYEPEIHPFKPNPMFDVKSDTDPAQPTLDGFVS